MDIVSPDQLVIHEEVVDAATMSPEPPLTLHEHRLDHNRSKLPSFRIADVKSPINPIRRDHDGQEQQPQDNQHNNSNNSNNNNNTIVDAEDDTISPTNTSALAQHDHRSTTTAAAPPPPLSSPLPHDSPPSSNPERTHARTRTRSGGPQSPPSSSPSALVRRPPRNHHHPHPHPVPASHSRNDLGSGPPPAMITQKVSLQALNTENSTKDWVANQSALTSPSATGESKTSSASAISSQPTTPLIPPIRGFRTSRRSTELAASRRVSMDQDDTLKALEGFNAQRFVPRDRDEQNEQNSDDSDLFLKLAREESAAAVRPANRRSQSTQINRQSLPPSSTLFHSTMDRRRGSDQGSALGFQSEHLYRSSTREKPPTALDASRARYFGSISQSTPTTPRGYRMRETSPDSLVSRSSRRPSIADPSSSSRASYRQSNLSQAFPRTFNSSPLVSRTADVQEGSDMPRAADGTESTVSTTAASTVWDELEDLKSRIHRLELTGKLPATSGAAMSRASNERPPTATTTVTTVSLSPKRVRNNSLSPTESALPIPGESHPLLTAALAKSKSLLSPEVYKALEATAADALTITSMMGTSGQPGPISSSQSTIGTPNGGVSDRQVRRKADSMCRSLTELCLALSEAQHEKAQATNKQTTRPRSRDTEAGSVVDNAQRPPLSTDLSRLKSSPRAQSRLEARRSSLLTGSALPSPRYAAPAEVTTPTQATMAGRRSSLLLRSRRAGTEEPEEEDSARFRTPSRAATDLGRLANSPREYTSQQPLPDSRLPTAQSSLPVRRHYVSTSLTNNSTPPLSAASGLGARRYLDRSTPDRDTSSVVSRATEERGLRKPSVGQIPVARTSSISRRVRQSYAADSPTTPQGGTYQ